MNTESKIVKLQSGDQLEIPKKLYDFLERNSYEILGNFVDLLEIRNIYYKDISSYVSHINLVIYYFVVNLWPCTALDIKFISNGKKTTFRSLMKEKIEGNFYNNGVYNDNIIKYCSANYNMDSIFYTMAINHHINAQNILKMLSVKNIKNNCNLPVFDNLIIFLKKVDEVSEWLDLYSGEKIDFDNCMFYFITEMFPFFSKKEKIDFIQKYWQATND